MAKEPRFSRRALAEAMHNAIEKFPENITGIARHVCLMPSFYSSTRYVFLQLKAPEEIYRDSNYRRMRQYLLEIACGAARNANPDVDVVVGIAIDAPKFHEENSEDFILMDCTDWSIAVRDHYDKANADLKFFNSGAVRTERTVSRFVPPTND